MYFFRMIFRKLRLMHRTGIMTAGAPMLTILAGYHPSSSSLIRRTAFSSRSIFLLLRIPRAFRRRTAPLFSGIQYEMTDSFARFVPERTMIDAALTRFPQSVHPPSYPQALAGRRFSRITFFLLHPDKNQTIPQIRSCSAQAHMPPLM